MGSADVRGWDPGDGPVSASGAARVVTRSDGHGLPDPPVTHTNAEAASNAARAQAVDRFREGVVICAADGVVRDVSDVAAGVFPRLRVGELLTATEDGRLIEAAGSGRADAEVVHEGRRIRVRRVALPQDRHGWYVEDVTEAVDRADALLAERSRSGFLANASQRLGNPLHVDRAARAAARLAVPVLGRVAVLVLAPRLGRARWWRAVAADDDLPVVDGGVLDVDDLPPAIDEALAGVEPHTANWLAEQLVQTGWLAGHELAAVSARVVPLPGTGAPTGALVLVRPAVQGFAEPDLQVLRGFAARAGAALNAAVLYREQADIAETLEASLLPIEPAPVPGLEWGTAYRPAQATLRIGGDFYGSHRLPDGDALFYLGDVSGKGVEAAVFTGQLRQAVQALRRVETEPRRLLALLNEAMLETSQAHGQGRFATIVLGSARPDRDGGVRLTLAGGGHLAPMLIRADGSVQTVRLDGMLVGVVPDARIGQVTVRLAAGETCLLYSDGVTEARGGRRGDEHFGADRLAAAMTGCHRMPAPALAERVEQVTSDWLAGREHDDIAVLAVRAAPVPVRHLRAVPDGRPERENSTA
ncbi:PP2C family protein-serine/threonine phosphatase [Micromonospora zhanjiangensis]